MRKTLIVIIVLCVMIAGTISGQDNEVPSTVELYLDDNYFVLLVSESLESNTENVSVAGLNFRAPFDDGIVTFQVSELFPILRATGSIVNVGQCYILIVDGSNPQLPNECDPDDDFLRNYDLDDVFWLDGVSPYRNEAYIELCNPDDSCTFQFTPFIPTPEPDFTLTAQSLTQAFEQVQAEAAQATAAALSAQQTQDAINSEANQTQAAIDSANIQTATQRFIDQQDRSATQVILDQTATQQAVLDNSATETALAPTATQTATDLPTQPPTFTPTPIATEVPNTPTSTPIPERLQISTSQTVTELAWSPDGRYIAGALRGGQVCIWDQLTLQISVCEQAHPSATYAVAWHPNVNDLRLVTSGADDRVRVWQFDTTAIIPVRDDLTAFSTGGTLEFTDVIWSPDSTKIAATDNQNRLFIWRTDTWDRQPQISIQQSNDIDWRSDSRYIVNLAISGGIQVIDSIENNVFLIGTHGGEANAADWGSAFGNIVTVGDDNTMRLYNYVPGQTCESPENCEYLNLSQNQSGMRDVSISPNGNLVAVALPGGVQVFETQLPDYLLYTRFDTNQSSSNVTALAWSPNNERLAGTDDNNQLYIWQVPDEVDDRVALLNQYSVSSSNAPIRSAVWSPEGASIAVVDNEANVNIWSFEEERLIASFIDEGTDPSAIDWARNRPLLATGSCTQATLWNISDLNNPLPSRSLAHPRCVRTLGFNPSSDLLMTSDGTRSVGGIMNLWNWETQSDIAGANLNQPITDLDWDSTGTRLAVSSETGRFVILDMVNNAARTIFSRQPRAQVFLNSITWSPNGQSVATGSDNTEIRIWDLQSAVTEGSFADSYLLEGHDTPVISVDWYKDPSQSYLATLSSDGVINIWHGPTGRRIARTTSLGAEEVIWSPTQLVFATYYEDGTIAFYELTP